MLSFRQSFIPKIIGVRDKGAKGAAALPALEEFAKISHNRVENQPKVGQNFRKQWIFYAYDYNCFVPIFKTQNVSQL